MEFTGKHRLVAHPDHPPRSVRSVEVSVSGVERITLVYRVEQAGGMVLPEHGPVRADRLWRSTCFELFVKRPDEVAYREFNFAPAAAWNAYSFCGWRAGMAPLEVRDPPRLAGRLDALPSIYEFEVVMARGALGESAAEASITTIIEEADGTMSYWALAHPPGEPDFHHPACFTATLPAIAP